MEKAQRRLMEEHDIMTALDNQQFAIWLQPQVACASGEICGAEVLLRQRQADGSWSLPPSLIERIESCGLIIPVGYWVMEEACRQLAAWQSQGIMLPLSVNVSLLQLLEHDRGEEMLKLIARYRIAPGTLILEVTESCRMDDPQDVMARLRPLREAGVQIALDDFGMGYAGLHQLQQMKALLMDILKIDKVFIDMLPEDVSMVPHDDPARARPVAAYRGGRGGERRPAPLVASRFTSRCSRAICSVALCRRRHSARAISPRPGRMQICKCFVDLCESAQRF